MSSILYPSWVIPVIPPMKKKVGRRASKQSLCLVCGDTARIKNYGALCCQACKTFFRRNASQANNELTCHYNGNCEVTKYTRLGCTACRLNKCFAIGMDPDFIRILDQTMNHSSTDRNHGKVKPLTTKCCPPILQTLDLLQNDRSTLTSQEWTLLSNVIHAYDKYDRTSLIDTKIKILETLPVEQLFDPSHTYRLFTTYYSTAQSFVASSPDYKVLTISEQCSLLKRNLNGLFIFCAEIVCRDLRMLDNATWSNTLTFTLGSDMIERKRFLNTKLEQDATLLKLMLIIIAFSSNCYMLDERQALMNDHLLLGTFRLLGSQNVFVEVLWKYMLHRYGFRDTVRRFSALVKQTLDLISLVVNMYKSDRWHQHFVDDTIKLATSMVKLDEKNSLPLWGKALPIQQEPVLMDTNH